MGHARRNDPVVDDYDDESDESATLEATEDDYPARIAPVDHSRYHRSVGDTWGAITHYIITSTPVRPIATALAVKEATRILYENLTGTCLSDANGAFLANLFWATYSIDLCYRASKWAITGKQSGMVSDLVKLGLSIYQSAPTPRDADPENGPHLQQLRS